MPVDLKHVKAMSALAAAHGFTVTSTTGGKHNANSLHAKGLAIDVRTKDKTPAEVEAFIKVARNTGYKVNDERARPKGQKVWGGPHLHISVIQIGENIAIGGGLGIIAIAAIFFLIIKK